jgi:ketosteroid isomerase-like protein
MSTYTERQQKQLEIVRQFFAPEPGFDYPAAIADDCVWWNPLPHIPGAEGVTEHRGKDAVLNILMGAGADHSAKGIDSYDLSTASYADVLTLCDGRYVLRQHLYRAKTRSGRDYENHYAFVFEFDDQLRIRHIWEHWDTLTATRALFRKSV